MNMKERLEQLSAKWEALSDADKLVRANEHLCGLEERCIVLQERQVALLAACKRFCDQIEWKPTWDKAGWKQCHEQVREAIKLCEEQVS